MTIEIFLTIWFMAAIIISLADAFYRIITEKDLERSWEHDAITSLLSAIIYGILLIWMYLSWWM